MNYTKKSLYKYMYEIDFDISKTESADKWNYLSKKISLSLRVFHKP